MANYLPMSAEAHKQRGYCCYESRNQHSRCVNCPYYEKPKPPKFTPDPRILDALLSGETITIYSEMQSLVPSVTLCNRVTVLYNSTKIPNNIMLRNYSYREVIELNEQIKSASNRAEYCEKILTTAINRLLRDFLIKESVNNLMDTAKGIEEGLHNEAYLQKISELIQEAQLLSDKIFQYQESPDGKHLSVIEANKQ
jgi:hypothetical protein